MTNHKNKQRLFKRVEKKIEIYESKSKPCPAFFYKNFFSGDSSAAIKYIYNIIFCQKKWTQNAKKNGAYMPKKMEPYAKKNGAGMPKKM